MQKLFRRSPCVLASSSLPLSTFPSFGVFKKMTILPSSSLSPNNLCSSLQNKVTKVPFLSNGSDVGNALNCSSNSFKICTNSCKSCTCYVVSCRGSDTLSNTFRKVPFSSSGSDVGKALSFSTKSCKSCTCYVGSCRGCGVGSGRAFSEVPFSSNGLDVGKALNFSTKSCGICTCALESCRGSRVDSGRAWGVLKGCKGVGGLNAWFGTLSGGGDDVEKDSFSVAAVGEGGSSSDENENENVVGSGKVARVNRRQRGSGSGGGVLLQGNPDLLTIPGVGPRNLRKLVEKGFDGVDQLKQFYKDKFFRESTQKMVEYLQSSVGIIHKSHAESITTFIKESVDKELKDDSSDSVLRASLKKRITLCVEGNISVGKTTFLQRIANETLELQDLVEVVPEPIDKWQNIGPDHFNILDAFYADPQRYAYTFQNYVFVTRVMQERESSAGLKPLRLMERSIFSDRMVFVRAVHEAKWMNEMEISIYDSWFDPVVSSLPGLIPDGFIYLRASPDTCHKRMMTRKREEEGGVSLEYLRGLHEKHESWLFPSESSNREVLCVSKLPDNLDCGLHPEIRDRVFYLEGTHMHPSIQKVPALVLNCEPNIDFNKDIDAKRQYALQVAKFFEFVKKKKEETTLEGNTDGSKNNQAQVLTAHGGGLWMPGAGNFPESALKSLDLKKAMSLMSRVSR